MKTLAPGRTETPALWGHPPFYEQGDRCQGFSSPAPPEAALNLPQAPEPPVPPRGPSRRTARSPLCREHGNPSPGLSQCPPPHPDPPRSRLHLLLPPDPGLGLCPAGDCEGPAYRHTRPLSRPAPPASLLVSSLSLAPAGAALPLPAPPAPSVTSEGPTAPAP